MIRHWRCTGVALAGLFALVHLAVVPTSVRAQLLEASPAQSEESAIVVEAYIYAYPLITMELMRRAQTNVGDGAPAETTPYLPGRAPMNQFAHQRALPDATTTTVQRPNLDVLTSSLWYDVGTEPLVVTVPDALGRYYSLSMLDLWTDVFASVGPRTSGRGRQVFALTARGWTGTLPAGVARIEAPTNVGLLLARFRADGQADLAAVHALQDGLRAAPLRTWNPDGPWTPPPAKYNAAVDMRSPWEQIPRLPAESYFKLFAELTKSNPPHPNDWPIRQRMARVGITPGASLMISSLGSETRAALLRAPTTAGQMLFEAFKRSGLRWNGWRIMETPIGTYGTDYRRRQVVAYSALGATVPEDMMYSVTIAAGDGKPLEGSGRYVMHFDAPRLPPVNAFWSLTVYDERLLLPATASKRWAVSDRDKLAVNDDGSLDLYIQSEAPGGAKDANWVATPRDGRFSLVLRLWWPKTPALDGGWQPPPVNAVEP